MNQHDYSPKNIAQWLAYVLRGALVGVGGILPGVSGGVLCVAFGIYKPMMEVLANPVRGLRQHYQMFIPFILGGAVGFVALAGMIGKLFSQESTLVTATFVGLIFGVFPALFREAGQEGRSRSAWIALLLSSLFLPTFFLVLDSTQALNISPNWGWFFFSGILFGVGVIVPGMSSSSLLIFLGLYGPMSTGIGDLDFRVLIPVGLGVVASVLMMARGVQKLFARYYAVTFHCIVGFVFASTIPIIPRNFSSTGEALQSALCCGAGFLLAYGMESWGTKIKPPGNVEATPADQLPPSDENPPHSP